MEHSNSYRLLKLRDILLRETDEDHELTINEIKERLSQFIPGGPIDSRTILRDIEALHSSGFELSHRRGRYGRHLISHQNRTFELYQIRLIVDAILSARFIPNNTKKEIIERLKTLTSKYNAKNLPDLIIHGPSEDPQEENVNQHIEKIHQAVSESKVITYQYGMYNINKDFTYNRDGDLYFVEPYGLVWQNEYYYLIGKFQPKNEIRHYRLDRIRNLQITEERFRKERFDFKSYIGKTFNMFAGDEVRIKLQFDIEIVPYIIDRFGKDVPMRKIDEDWFEVSTRVKLSTGLISWILGWGSQARVISPDSLVEQMKEEVEKMYHYY